MPMITVRMRGVTVHRRHPASTARVDTISGLDVPVGDARTTEIPPGVPFEVEESEGLALLRVHSGEVVADVAPEAEAAP
jgi:hypothetical protein